MKKFVLLTLLSFASVQFATQAAETDNVDLNGFSKRLRDDRPAQGNEDGNSVENIEKGMIGLQLRDHTQPQRLPDQTIEFKNALAYVDAYRAACTPVQQLYTMYDFEEFASRALLFKPDATPDCILGNFVVSGATQIINSPEYSQYITVRAGNKRYGIVPNKRYNSSLSKLVEDLAPFVKR